MRYRYITNSGVTPDDNISDYRLLDKQKLQGKNQALRVEIPEDAVLEKWNCDEYSTWDETKNDDNYQLKNMNPKICVKFNGRWKVLEEAMPSWFGGEKMSNAIKNSIGEKYYPIPILHFGYLDKEQHLWVQKNWKMAWRFDKLPSDFKNTAFPSLTPSQKETLDYVRKAFLKYCDEAVDDSLENGIKTRLFIEEDAQEAKDFFRNFIQTLSDDALAYEWHRYSRGGLDPYKKFETVEMIEKMKKNPYDYVDENHYQYAIFDMIENMAYYYQKYKDNEDYEYELDM